MNKTLKSSPFDETAMQYVREKRLLIDRFDDWLYDEYNPYIGQHILEIGCGLGNQICHFLNRDLVVGIDVSHECIEQVRQVYYKHENLEFYSVDILDPDIFQLREKDFDTVISINVFEHIENDELALHHARQLLKPNGKLILVVPAHQSLYGSMDASIGHFRRYTKQTLATKMFQTGFEIVNQKYINMLGALGWGVNGKLLHRSVPPSGQLRLFNAIVPYLRKIENRVKAPFGISLITVAQ